MCVMQRSYVMAAKEFWVVQKEVAELIKGRILVGHALHNDLKVGVVYKCIHYISYVFV